MEIRGRLNRLHWKPENDTPDEDSPSEELDGADPTALFHQAVATLSWIRITRAALSAESMEQMARREAVKKKMVEV